MKYAQSDSIPLISWPLKSFTMLLEMPNRYFQGGGYSLYQAAPAELYRITLQLCLLLCGDDQHHGAAELIFHSGYFLNHGFRRLRLYYAQQAEAVLQQSIQIGSKGSMVF